MDISSKLTTSLESLIKKSDGKVQIENLEEVVSDLSGLFETCLQETDKKLYKNIEGISDKIKETRESLSQTLPDGVVADAAMELDAIIKSTEEATDKILDVAEHIQELAGKCSDEQISKDIISDASVIFEACNFQDLTGQRIQKVTSALEYIEKAVSGMLEDHEVGVIKEDKRMDADLMNGPQSLGSQPNQDDVDKLFDNA